MNNSWALSDPSPWISAKEFNLYWKDIVYDVTYKGQDILNNPSIVYNLSFYTGDVVQMLKKRFLLGGPGDAAHTMYITGYGNHGGSMSYLLAYHSSNAVDKNLIEICEKYPDHYFAFYAMD
ncbi:MAG: amidase domain-containing protein [Oscillospiraceae bacterium]|nr:amidase domain-containing protein [Oscillospiraceae bacterium]